MGSVFNLEDQNRNLDGKLTVGLEKMASVFRSLVWEEAKLFGLSPIQVQILIFIKSHSREYATVSYLAKEFQVSKPTISDAVKILLAKDLIQKEADKNDARSYSISLTPQGFSLVSKSENYTNPILSLIENLKEENKEILWSLLSQLIYQMHLNGVVTVQRMCYSCSFYKEKNSQSYCGLLAKPLLTTEIRFDCPEHKAS